MKSSESTLLIDNYLGLLNSLSKENKLRIISRLSNSMANEVESNESVVDKFFGAFESDKSAEEIIQEIRENRIFNRSIEAF